MSELEQAYRFGALTMQAKVAAWFTLRGDLDIAAEVMEMPQPTWPKQADKDATRNLPGTRR